MVSLLIYFFADHHIVFYIWLTGTTILLLTSIPVRTFLLFTVLAFFAIAALNISIPWPNAWPDLIKLSASALTWVAITTTTSACILSYHRSAP